MLTDQIAAARRAGVPLIAIRTPDPAATEALIQSQCNGTVPCISWDLVRGVRGLNTPGEAAATLLDPRPDTIVSPTDALSLFPRLPEKTVVLFRNLHRVIDNEAVVQAVSNLRDPFKGSKRTLIALGVDIVLPAELTQEVVVFDEELPGDPELGEIVNSIYAPQAESEGFAGPPVLDSDAYTTAVSAVTGLSAFAAEQAVAMSMSKSGLDQRSLEARNEQMINQTKGLKIYRGSEKLSDVCGADRITGFMSNVLDGPEAPEVVLFIDEIEKSTGSQQDTSGVSQDFLKMLLTTMEDSCWTGLIAIGPPGSGKSMLAKSIPRKIIQLDLGGLKGSLVGESEAGIRNAMRVVNAVGRGKVFVIATCNSIGTLPPELRRRFTMGTWFFDLPTANERGEIWGLYTRKYNLDPEEVALLQITKGDWDRGWTGAEIRNCCDLAHRLNCTIEEASSYIVPVAIAASATIEKLREEASGRYLSASYFGRYQKGMNRETSNTRVMELV